MSMRGVSIYCKEKKILFTLEGETVIFEGVKSRSLPCVISALQALRSVRNGCQAFLTSVVDTSKETPLITDMKIVPNFQDVFLEDLPGLPLEREVEFSIEL